MRPTERDLIQSQLRHANVVFLTKTDLVSAVQRVAAFGLMQAAAPGALVIGATTAEVTLDLLLGGQLRGPVRQPPEARSAPQAQDLFRSWQVRECEPFTKARFQALHQPDNRSVTADCQRKFRQEAPASRAFLIFGLTQLRCKTIESVPVGGYD